jgi:tripeptidyl-peptidase-1
MEELVDRPTGELPLVLSLSLGSLTFGACDQLCQTLASTTTHTYAECHAYLQQQRQICLYASSRQQDRINTAFKLLGLRGTTVLGASGDGGPHWSFGPFPASTEIGRALTAIGCHRMSPLFPASSPYILAVGGISWVNDNPADPVAWNQHEGSTGGGFSDVWAMPPFQKTTVAGYFSKVNGQPGVPPTHQYNGSNRAYPDVAAFMDGVPLCVDGRCTDSICGGTSASTPTVAGIISLLNDVRLNSGLPPLGFVVPRIWHVAQTFPGEAFVDVNSPANTSTGCETFFPTAQGWDPQTGWGYPHWPGLVKHLGSDAS